MGMTTSEAAASSRMKLAGQNEASNASAQDSTLGQYEGDLQSSPMYKRMYNARLQDTTQAYNNARSSRSARARMSGFGYTSPQAGRTTLPWANSRLTRKVTSAAIRCRR
jgi:hypothetical protein